MKKAIRGIAILMSFVFLLNTLLSGIYLSYFLVSKRDFVAAYCQTKPNLSAIVKVLVSLLK